jgi:hypothetical protein
MQTPNPTAQTPEHIRTAGTLPATFQMIPQLVAENAALRAALASLLPLAIHTSPEDVAVHQARAALAGKGVQS